MAHATTCGRAVVVLFLSTPTSSVTKVNYVEHYGVRHLRALEAFLAVPGVQFVYSFLAAVVMQV